MVQVQSKPVPKMISSTGLSLRSNFTWTLFGTVSYAASQWAILMILAKVGSPALVGRFSLALAIIAPILMLANLQLRAVQATDAKGEYRFGEYLGLRLLTTGLAYGVLLVLSALGGYGTEAAMLILALGLAKSFESVSDITYGLMQKHERMDWIAISMMIKGPLSLAALIGVYMTTHNLVFGVLGMALVWLGLLVFYDLGKARRLAALRPSFRPSVLSRLTVLALPLGLVMMLLSLNSTVPRYFLEHNWGEAELGYFSALAYLMLVGSTIVSALGQSAMPRLAKNYAELDYRSFRRLLVRLGGIAVVLGGLGVMLALLFGHQVLKLLYRPDYAEQTALLVWLMLVAAVNYVSSFMGYGMTAARYFRVQLPLFAIVTGVMIVSSAILIPANGSIGAAQAMGIAAVTQLIASLAINSHAVRTLKRLSTPERMLS
jgi:O-antigen/teichoic acid export membrane protein